MRSSIRCVGLALMLSLAPLPAAAEEFTNAIHPFLERHLAAQGHNGGMVVGIVDEHGSRVVACGQLDNGTGGEVNGDTLFELGSITKTFTALLLQDMIERGEMKLDDPAEKYFPRSVKMPAHNGKPITLRHLVTHTSGLPFFPTNLHPQRVDNPYAGYTVEHLQAFLSGYALPRNPGKRWDYSEVAMQVLGQAIALKAGKNYEALLVDRICGPLHMDSTRVTLTPEMKARFAQGHNLYGYRVPSLECGELVGGGALHSTTHDLLKYLSANLGLTRLPLTPLMERTHAPLCNVLGGVYQGMGWLIARNMLGTKVILHPGGTFGHSAFIGLDKGRRRGVVVLSSSDRVGDTRAIAQFVLESEWQADRRPRETTVPGREYEACVGQYRLVPNYLLGLFTLRILLLNVPPAGWWGAGGVCVAVGVFGYCVKRAGWLRQLSGRFCFSWHRRLRLKRLLLGGLALVGVISLALDPLIANHLVYGTGRPGVGIRRDGDRLILQPVEAEYVGVKCLPQIQFLKLRLPPTTTEVLAASDSRFFERLSGFPLAFARNARGKVTRLTLRAGGRTFAYEKFTEQAPEEIKPPAAVKLDAKLYDACVGRYEFGPDDLFPDGITLTLRRQGDGLTGEASNRNGSLGAADIYAESPTNFFVTIGVHLIFNQNDKREVSSVIRRVPGWPDCTGKKVGP